MSRRSYKTVNLPREVADWIDAILLRPGGAPLGITSRDEFVRIAVVVLGAALQPSPSPLELVQGLARGLEKQRSASPGVAA